VRLFRAALIRMWLISTRVNKPENVQLWNLAGLIASVVVVEHLLTLKREAKLAAKQGWTCKCGL